MPRKVVVTTRAIPVAIFRIGNGTRRPLIIAQEAVRARSAFLDFCAKDATGSTREAHGSRDVHPNGGIPMAGEVNRRSFLSSLGVRVGAAVATDGGAIPVVGVAHATAEPKGNIHYEPYRIGH